MFKIDKLTQAEREIQNLLNQNEANWKDVAKIALAVREKELFKQSGIKSFTAWVKMIATRCDRSPSLIWRYIKAAKYYLYTVGSNDVEQVNNALAAPETLVNLEKVEQIAPQKVFEKLKEKVLAGEATVIESRKIEKEYRPENKSTKGNLNYFGKSTDYIDNKNEVGDKNEREDARVASFLSSHAVEAIKEVSVTESRPNRIATKISNSLKINLADWTKKCLGMRYPPKHSQSHTEVRVNNQGKRLRLDFLAVTRWSYKKPKDVFIVEIKSSLADFENDSKWEHYLNFCDYFCFAILGGDLKLREAIEDNTNTEVGILEVNFSSKAGDRDGIYYKPNVYRKPKKLEPDKVCQIYETLYERVLGWSGKGYQSKGDEKKVPRNPNFCNPVIGNRVFAVHYSYRYSFGSENQAEWHTVGAIDEKDATEYIKELKILVGGEKPKILKVVELFYNGKTRMWECE